MLLSRYVCVYLTLKSVCIEIILSNQNTSSVYHRLAQNQTSPLLECESEFKIRKDFIKVVTWLFGR